MIARSIVFLLGVLAFGCDQPARRQSNASTPTYYAAPAAAPELPPEEPKVETFALLITVLCEPFSPPTTLDWDQESQKFVERLDHSSRLAEPPRIANGVLLSRRNGVDVRLSDVGQAPISMEYDEGRYRITIEYHPDDPAQIVGAPIASLRGFESLVARYTKVLAAHDLRFLGLTKAEVVVNGRSFPLLESPSLQEEVVLDNRLLALVDEAFVRAGAGAGIR